MKVMTFILVMLLLDSCKAQEPLYFSKVVYVDSTVLKDELYTRARLWFSEAFNDSRAVLEIQDKEAGQLVGKGNMAYHVTKLADECYEGDIKFDIKVFVKDGRYKYELSDFVHSSNTSYTNSRGCDFGLIFDSPEKPGGKTNPWTTKNRDNINWASVISKIKDSVSQMLESLNSRMNKPASKKDDW